VWLLRYIFPLTDQLLIGALEKTFVTPLLGGRMKRWLLAGTLALAAGGQGLASDLPPPAVPPAPRAPAAYIPPVSPVYNWGGIYFGFNLGQGLGIFAGRDRPRLVSGTENL